MAGEEGGGVETATAFGLELVDGEGACAAGDGDAVGAGVEDGAGERAAGWVVEGGDWREDLELGAVREGSGGAGPWVEGADAAFEGVGGE